MGERKGQNKYYPPDFDYKKHKSLAGYHGEHPLRERARKINQGILVIRFEMPYNIWCGGCGIHIAMGVRYNAEKSKIGNYYTTPIYKFRMKCHLCDNYFEIKTDPANHDYVIMEGARRKEQRWDPKENEQIVPDDRAAKKKLATDAMFKLEHGSDDKDKISKAIPRLHELTDRQSLWKEDYMLNKALRKQFRDEKKALNAAAEADRTLLEKSSLDIELLPEHGDDIKMAGLLKYQNLQSFDEKQEQIRREIETRPIFEENALTSPPNSDVSESKKFMQQTRKHLRLATAQSPFSVSKPGASNLSKSLNPSVLGIVRKRNSDNHKSNCETSVTSSVSTPSSSSSSSSSSVEFTSAAISSAPLSVMIGREGHEIDERLFSQNKDLTKSEKEDDVSVDHLTMNVCADEIVEKNNALNSLMSNYESCSDSGPGVYPTR